MACGIVVAVSPTMTWFRGTTSATGNWSGFGLHRDRDELEIKGNALMMGFDGDGWHTSLFGPATPVLAGIALALGGLAVTAQRARPKVRWIASGSAVIALWSIGAAGLTARSGVDPGGNVGGPGIRAWAIGSAIGAISLVVVVAANQPHALGSVLFRRIVDWAPMPAILLAGVAGELLYSLEEHHLFASGPVFIAASLTAALPAAGTVAAVVAVAPAGRSLLVTVVNTTALVLGVLLFALWSTVALT